MTGQWVIQLGFGSFTNLGSGIWKMSASGGFTLNRKNLPTLGM